jgi:hypothetical protein
MHGRWLVWTHLVTHARHRLLVGFWHGTLMVTEDRDHSVGLVVCVELLLDGSVMRCLLVELNLESLRSVEGTKNLGGKSFHVSVQVRIQLGGLSNVEDENQTLATHLGAE